MSLVSGHVMQCQDTGGGVVVNTDGVVVAAMEASQTSSHPLHHTAMLLVDKVAVAQGGGIQLLNQNITGKEIFLFVFLSVLKEVKDLLMLQKPDICARGTTST